MLMKGDSESIEAVPSTASYQFHCIAEVLQHLFIKMDRSLCLASSVKLYLGRIKAHFPCGQSNEFALLQHLQ